MVLIDFEDAIAHQIFPHSLSGLNHGVFMRLKLMFGVLNHISRRNEFAYVLLEPENGGLNNKN